VEYVLHKYLKLRYDLAKMGHNSTKSIQVIVEAERRAYADRTFLGDDFVKCL
jgi:gamma-glutamyltranspeptidase/glutathione hydrolase